MLSDGDAVGCKVTVPDADTVADTLLVSEMVSDTDRDRVTLRDRVPMLRVSVVLKDRVNVTDTERDTVNVGGGVTVAE